MSDNQEHTEARQALVFECSDAWQWLPHCHARSTRLNARYWVDRLTDERDAALAEISALHRQIKDLAEDLAQRSSLLGESVPDNQEAQQ